MRGGCEAGKCWWWCRAQVEGEAALAARYRADRTFPGYGVTKVAIREKLEERFATQLFVRSNPAQSRAGTHPNNKC